MSEKVVEPPKKKTTTTTTTRRTIPVKSRKQIENHGTEKVNVEKPMQIDHDQENVLGVTRDVRFLGKAVSNPYLDVSEENHDELKHLKEQITQPNKLMKTYQPFEMVVEHMEIEKEEFASEKNSTNNNSIIFSAEDTIQSLHLFVCVDHDAPYDMFPASFAIGRNEEDAINSLDKKLALSGCKTYSEVPYTLSEIKTNYPAAIILSIGSVPAYLQKQPKKINGDEEVALTVKAKKNASSTLNFYTCTDHHSIYPTSPASIIISYDEISGQKILDNELMKRGCRTFKEHTYSLVKVDGNKQGAFILTLGKYGGYRLDASN